MTARAMIGIITLAGGAVGLLAPIGFVKWLLRTDEEAASDCRGVAWWALIAQGTSRDRRQAGRAEIDLSQIPSTQIATMVPSVARPLMVHPVA